MVWRFVALLTAMALTGAAFAGQWRNYVNDRFGAAAEIPSAYIAGEAPANDDGLTFTSPEGDVTIKVWGALAKVEDESFPAYASRLMGYDRDGGWTITYSVGKKDWFAFSGRKDGRIFYEKVIAACKGEIANHIRLDYPEARKAEFDAIVAHAVKSLHSKKGYQC